MSVIGIQSSPNRDGLTSRLVQAALEGARSEGAETELVHLNELRIKSCEAHGDGWGSCLSEGRCAIGDDFEGLRQRLNGADALVFGTPVYFGDLSESAKRLMDRWRRCENYDHGSSPLKGKLAIGIAAAGGSGGGAVSALLNLEGYLDWLQYAIFDLVPVTQKSKAHKLDMLRAAGKRLVVAQRSAGR
jgi:multimeric flavodoxin WrbA